jgi:hypothetical protein
MYRISVPCVTVIFYQRTDYCLYCNAWLLWDENQKTTFTTSIKGDRQMKNKSNFISKILKDIYKLKIYGTMPFPCHK